MLGQGLFGKMFKATIKKAQKRSLFVIKRVGRWGLKEKGKENLFREVTENDMLRCMSIFPSCLRRLIYS